MSHYDACISQTGNLKLKNINFDGFWVITFSENMDPQNPSFENRF